MVFFSAVEFYQLKLKNIIKLKKKLLFNNSTIDYQFIYFHLHLFLKLSQSNTIIFQLMSYDTSEQYLLQSNPQMNQISF